jgi:uncharacterized protein
MSAGPLPNRVNIRKAVTRSARYSGVLSVEQLPQFSSVLDPVQPCIEVVVQFGEDEEGQQYAEVSMDASVTLECQRCLGPVALSLTGRSKLGLVHSDEQGRQLSSGYEPLIAVDEVDLWEVASEELALALPVVAYHPEGECRPPGEPQIEQRELATEGKENPFSVLSALLDGNDLKEK